MEKRSVKDIMNFAMKDMTAKEFNEATNDIKSYFLNKDKNTKDKNDNKKGIEEDGMDR